MSARTVEEGYFGSAGHGDPKCAYTERTISTSWDFSKKNVPENKTIPLMQIPKGFCIDRISVVQTKFADQSVGLTFGLKSDNSYTVGSTFTLAASSSMLRSSQAPKTTAGYIGATSGADTTTTAISVGDSLFVDGDDVLCMIVPDGLTGDKCAAGAFDLFVHGFSVFGEGPTDNKTGNHVFRKTLQTQDNVAGERPSFD